MTAPTQPSAEEARAITSISILAAFADGHNHERERGEIKRIADALAQREGVHVPSIVQAVLMNRMQLAETAACLRTPAARQLAYEMSVCVCDADGAQTPRERAFLRELQVVLHLDGNLADQFSSHAEEITAAPVDAPLPSTSSSSRGLGLSFAAHREAV